VQKRSSATSFRNAWRFPVSPVSPATHKRSEARQCRTPSTILTDIDGFGKSDDSACRVGAISKFRQRCDLKPGLTELQNQCNGRWGIGGSAALTRTGSCAGLLPLHRSPIARIACNIVSILSPRRWLIFL
jgi:hypothetical protein